MEPAAATAFPVARDAPPRPAPQTAQLGQGPERREWGAWGWLFVAVVSIVLAGRFALGVYDARDSPWELAFVIVTYYLIAVLFCCLAKLNLLRLDDPAAAPERRRVRIVASVVWVALAVTVAARVALEVPYLGLKIAVLVITGVGIGLGFYFFRRVDARRAGRQDDNAPHKMSPEQSV